jgi:serine/threonine protein kinase
MCFDHLRSIIEQANVMQVFEFRDVPEPMIIMEYYPEGNMADASVVDEERRLSALGQVLDGLSHLHTKGLAHRDLKPENLLVKLRPFQVVITDFGLSKLLPDATLLKTFCGTLRYAAPEVFPGLSYGYGPKVDVWSLGIIALEWIYGLPALPAPPKPRRNRDSVKSSQWQDWVMAYIKLLDRRLMDEESGQLIDLLDHMIENDVRRRWSSKQCLALGFENGLFRRRKMDGLVVCIYHDEGIEDTPTPTAASPAIRASAPLATVGIDPGATVVLEKMWDHEGPSGPH